MSGLSLVSLKPEDLTWDMAFRSFSLRCRSQNLAATTQIIYTEKLGAFRRWLVANEDPRPAEVRPGHLRAFLEFQKARGISDLTVDCFFRVLRTLWRFLHRDGLVLVDPMTKVERPRRERRFVKPVTAEQLRLILAQIDTKDILGLRDYTLILLLADTGLRLGEALALKLNEIDWSSNTVVVFGKGRKERRVSFGQTARAALMTWARRRGVIEGSDWVFLTRHGTRMKINGADQRMKDYTRRAGIAARRLSPHALRHFFALTFLRNGGDVMALQRIMGHATLEVLRGYVSMCDDDTMAQHRRASPLDNLGLLPGQAKRVRLR